MAGMLNALLGAMSAMLTASLNVGNDGVPVNYGYVSTVYGSITPAVFTDHGGNSRTVAIWNWNINASGGVSFRLLGTGIANSDTTFVSVAIGGRVLLRSAATYTANDAGVRTQWTWSLDTSAYPITGAVQAVVK